MIPGGGSTRIFVLHLTGLSLSSLLFGQTNSRPAFDVATIKPAPADENGGGYRFEPGGRAVMSNFTLKNLVMVAWHVQDYQVAGGPSWADSERYDIEAEAGGNPDESTSRLMLQSLLIQRFGLRVHPETRELPGYVLVPANSEKPSALLASREGSCTISSMDFPPRRKADETPYCGFTQKLKGSASGGRTMELHGSGVALAMFARVLGNILDCPVKDLTDIDGRFDFTFEYADEDMRAKPLADTLDSGPSLFSAIQEQLGLKLQLRRVPVEVLDLDRAVRLTGN